MKFKSLFAFAAAAALAFAGCEPAEENLGEARISVNPTSITFAAGDDTQAVTLVATRDWHIDSQPDWVALDKTSGSASTKDQTVTVSVDANKLNDREGEVVFTIGLAKASLTVKQAGEAGEYVVETVSIADFIKTDGTTEYIISGKITSVSTDYKYAYINDGTGEVEVYQPSNWSEFVDKVKVGATMTAQGVYTKYTSNSGKSYDELVGVILSVEEKSPQTDVTTVSCADFIKTDGETEYIISGKVTSMNTSYKYAYIDDGTAEVEVYQPTNWDEYVSKIKTGVTLKAQGVYKKYTNSSGKSYDELVGVILDVTEGDTPDPTPSNPAGTGTLEDPYNAAGVLAFINTLEGSNKSENDVYVKGKVSSVKYAFDAEHGTATFDISDDGTTSGSQFTCYSVYTLGNQAWVEGNTQVAVGDEVIICGKVYKYNGSIPETASKEAYIYSLNGKTTDTTGPVFGVERTEINVGASATEATVNVTGNVAWTAASSDAKIEPASGNGAGAIKVTFDANTDTEKAKTYTVVVTTTADVATKSYTVTITQSKASAAGESTVTLDFTAQGYENAQAVESLTVEGVTVTFDKGTNSNAPKFYTSGSAVRVYGSNNFTVKADGKNVTKVEFTFGASDGSNEITVDSGKFTSPVWEGDASSVKFTVGGTSGNRRLAKMVVTVK